jgi:hypothetical protein
MSRRFLRLKSNPWYRDHQSVSWTCVSTE